MADEAPPPPYHRPISNSVSVPNRLVVRNSFNVGDGPRPQLVRAPRGASVGPIHSTTPPASPTAIAVSSVAQAGGALGSDSRVVQAVSPFALGRQVGPTPPSVLQSMVDAYQTAVTGAPPRKSSFSASQPDIANEQLLISDASPRHLMSASLHSPATPESGHLRSSAAMDSRIGQRMLAQLSDENKRLRNQLAAATAATARLSTLESQYEAVERDYQELVRRQERREELEKEMRSRLDDQVRGLHQNNLRLQQQLDLALLQLQAMDAQAPDDLPALLQELRAEKAALAGLKERQEMELEAQRATLEEQRTHIHILDKALANAQEKALRLDGQLKRRTPLVEEAEASAKLAASLQAELRRREEAFRNRESQLQMQIASLSLSKGAAGAKKSSWDESELLGRLYAEVESKDHQVEALSDEVSSLQVKLGRLLAEREAGWESDEETDPSEAQRVRDLQTRLAEKDGIIRALLQTKRDRDAHSAHSSHSQRAGPSRVLDATKALHPTAESQSQPLKEPEMLKAVLLLGLVGASAGMVAKERVARSVGTGGLNSWGLENPGFMSMLHGEGGGGFNFGDSGNSAFLKPKRRFSRFGSHNVVEENMTKGSETAGSGKYYGRGRRSA